MLGTVAALELPATATAIKLAINLIRHRIVSRIANPNQTSCGWYASSANSTSSGGYTNT
jgi:hypothetical protein